MLGDIHFVSYAAGQFRQNIEKNLWFVNTFIKPKSSHVFTDDDLKKSEFYHKNKVLLDEPRGAGYWAWKPYFILQQLQKIPREDILIYQDCGVGYRYKNFITPTWLIAFAKKHSFIPGIYIPERGINKRWTKRSVLTALNCDSELYWNTPQVQATLSFWKHDDKSIAFLTEWLSLCRQKQLIDDSADDAITNYDEFIEHRHDQSLLTLLAVKHHAAVPNNADETVMVNKSISMIELHFRAKKSFFYRLYLSALLFIQKLK
ncbi:hypothetical protein [Thalassotalea atypica]|uniref:hypothetical protein n=1 Tax=Thalassotalea atypica TaxID=2054316 RepID=UPI002572DE19|nr:hypothetical protein [Thalassotalea atypica]